MIKHLITIPDLKLNTNQIYSAKVSSGGKSKCWGNRSWLFSSYGLIFRCDRFSFALHSLLISLNYHRCDFSSISSPSARSGKAGCSATATTQRSWWWMPPAWRCSTLWCPRSPPTGSAPWASSGPTAPRVRRLGTSCVQSRLPPLRLLLETFR